MGVNPCQAKTKCVKLWLIANNLKNNLYLCNSYE